MFCTTLYCVDYHQELLDELRSNFKAPGLSLIKNSGNDFPSVPDHSIDFLFSHGVFVHLELDTIDQYLQNMKRVIKPATTIIIHYSDKTKRLGRDTVGFGDNDPARMRALVLSRGYRIQEEDLDILPHSAVVRFSL